MPAAPAIKAGDSRPHAGSGERTIELELAEEINLQLELANVGSRSLAILVDIALCGAVVFLVYSLTYLAGHDMALDWLTRVGSSALQIALVVLIFGSQWLYFGFFEWAWNGQTPGKRMLRLRVIKMDGTSVSWTDVLLRNLARPIDTFGPMGLIGLFMIFVSRKGQRLGDWMARTLVIHEAAIDWSIFDQLEESETSSAGMALPSVRLTSAQWELLHRYLNRRATLPPEIRERMAESLRESFRPAVRGTELERSALAAEDWLRELARRT
jgi:uncharacterized RDD family membrane protein YckC